MDINSAARSETTQSRAPNFEETRGRESGAPTAAKFEEPARPAVVVERASAELDPGVYSAPRPASLPPAEDLAHQSAPRPASLPSGEALGHELAPPGHAYGRRSHDAISSRISEFHIGTLIQLDANGGPSTTILGDGASLEINLHLGTFVRLGDGQSGALGDDSEPAVDKLVRLVGGGGTTILGPGSVFEVGDPKLGTLIRLGGPSTIILGDGASMKINADIGTVIDTGSGAGPSASRSAVAPPEQTAPAVSPPAREYATARELATSHSNATAQSHARERSHAVPSISWSHPRAHLPEPIDQRWMLLRDVYDSTNRSAIAPQASAREDDEHLRRI